VAKVILHRLSGTKKAQEVCRLVETLCQKGRRVVVWLSDAGRAATLDEYLWTFAQYSFVPHALWNGHDAMDDPVAVVTGALSNPNRADVLVVGDRLAVPAEAAGFAEVHDLVASGSEDAGKQEAWEAAGFSAEDARRGSAGRRPG
jgi:DNA polymerase-3 subunit chi